MNNLFTRFIGPRDPFQYRIRRLLVRSRKSRRCEIGNLNHRIALKLAGTSRHYCRGACP